MPYAKAAEEKLRLYKRGIIIPMKEKFSDKFNKINRSRLIKTVLSGVFTVIFYYIQYYISTREDYSELRYLRQAFFVLMLISAIIFLICLWKLFPKKLLINYGRIFMNALGISGAIEKIYKKLHEIFGLPDRASLRGSKDKKSFIVDNPLKRILKKRTDADKTKLKWKDLETNQAKIRYIYAMYIRKSIKEGFHFDASKTPDELSNKLTLNDESKKLFGIYVGARYSDGSFEIDDNDVDSAARLVSKNGKIT